MTNGVMACTSDGCYDKYVKDVRAGYAGCLGRNFVFRHIYAVNGQFIILFRSCL